MEPEELCEAFIQLSESRKVKEFGVGNDNSMQIELFN